MQGVQQVFDMLSQLRENNQKANKRIPTSSIDSIFFEMEAELDEMTQEKLLTTEDLHAQKYAFQELIHLTEAALKLLKAVEFMNDHQFYCFLRLKKIFSNLESFRSRYDSLLKQIAPTELSNPIAK